MSEVLLEHPLDGVALLRINRPEAKNALNAEVRRQLAEHMGVLGTDKSVRAIVLTGNAEAFAAGADIKDMAEIGAIELMLRNNHLLWRTIAQCPKPVIAAVNGYAWGGGCELAMHADIIVAGENASFSQPEVKVGIMPGAGGTQRLVRAVGKYKAMWLAMTAQPITGIEAGQMGLASTVVPDSDVLSAALDMAKTIARMPPLAIAQIKEVMLAGMDAPLETALMLERKAFQMLFASRDQKEGMKAFLEKRKPAYEGL
ncbi:enoyl-CoA hydratase [Paramagnetospirillum kuznetsovii]|uniref:Enoyl-CoA hydratase n=1 Tax=Paramagnetospirillum kuznetsovii TaxID=2053833 RepID=A0A364NWH5_9PROT|nr:enoyl-CoA hydratase [Paramagnetospirillum kuznetsovii]RAU21412.1 enoyl-CoA hydratase [Paramagnetospirillum kuznetsovii]